MAAPRRRTLVISVALVAAILAGAGLIFSRHLSLTEVQEIARQTVDWSERHPALVFACLAAACAVTMSLALPAKALLTLLSGALLGTVWGTVATSAGVLAGTTVLFFAVRRWLAPRLAPLYSDRVMDLESRASSHPVRTMIGLRTFLVLPFGACTVTAALTRMRYREFLAGTFIGDTPVILLYAAAGRRLFTLTSTSEALSPSTIAILMGVGTLFLAGALFGRRRDRSG